MGLLSPQTAFLGLCEALRLRPGHTAQRRASRILFKYFPHGAEVYDVKTLTTRGNGTRTTVRTGKEMESMEGSFGLCPWCECQVELDGYRGIFRHLVIVHPESAAAKRVMKELAQKPLEEIERVLR